MKLVDLDIKSFIEKLESSSPTPGGGSASALAVALGISLVLMVVNITAAKKKSLRRWPTMTGRNSSRRPGG